MRIRSGPFHTFAEIYFDVSLRHSASFCAAVKVQKVFRSAVVRCAVRPDLAKFCHFGKIFKSLGNFKKLHEVFDKILSLLWPKDPSGQI